MTNRVGWQPFSEKVVTCYTNVTEYILKLRNGSKKHIKKHYRTFNKKKYTNEDTALKLSVANYWGGLELAL